jgi:hypothetical protein
MPFFLCQSGKDLFSKVPKISAKMIEPSIHQGRKEQVPAREGSKKGSDISNSRNAQPSTDDDEGDSALSSISSSVFAGSSPLSTAARTSRNVTPSELSVFTYYSRFCI